ncbi:MAG: GGDEF domain-containing protein [Desulfuromonadales bacterium]|nr:GGDEF domain-containing protein [Desulfuromonadales bacterium]
MLFRIHKKTVDHLSARISATVIAISLLLLALLGWSDYLTGDYSLIIFYLVPVSLVAWFVSMPAGMFFCILAVFTRFIADEYSSSFALNNAPLHYWNLFVEFLFLTIMSLLFSALRRNLDSEKTRASTDPLTGVLNRRAFFDIAEYELNRSQRYEHAITMAYIDLDNFKEINDRLGHSVGDKLLKMVTETIASHIRSTDIISRFGGDEFVILLPETPGDAAATFLTKIHNQLDQAMSAEKWPVGFSIGAVTYPSPPASVDEIVKKADMLMYEVKRSGKNRLLHIVATEATNG